MKNKIKPLIISIFPIIFIIIALLYNNSCALDLWIEISIILITVIFCITYFIFENKIPNWINKLILIVVYGLSVFYLSYNFLSYYDLLKYFTSITATKELILASGSKGYLVFILIQIAQVVFLPIPAVALIVVGLVIYGPIKTIIFCSLGVLLGSYISFLFGKTFGYKFVSWLVGEQRVKKYANILKTNGKFILSVVFIFPFFPDDLFCMIAGISNMTFKEFFILATLLRPISIIVVCLFGGGTLFDAGSLGSIILVIIALGIIISMIIFFTKNKKIKNIMMLMKQKN